MRRLSAYLMVFLCGALAAVRPANGLQTQGVRTGTSGLLREEQTLIVNGAAEVWRLEWKSTPKPYCVLEARDESWAVCPCDGFAFGEAGPLDFGAVAE